VGSRIIVGLFMILLTLTMGHSLRMRFSHKWSLLSATRISSSSFVDSRNLRVNSASCSLFWRALWIGPNEGKIFIMVSSLARFFSPHGGILRNYSRT
jgi:hypothetical protein